MTKHVPKPYKRVNTGTKLSSDTITYIELFKAVYAEYVSGYRHSSNWIGLDKIEGSAAKVVWLYLRESEEYQACFKTFAKDADLADDFKRTFCFGSPPIDPEVISTDNIIFNRPTPVLMKSYSLTNPNFLQRERARLSRKELLSTSLGLFKNMLMIVPPFTSPKVVAKQLDNLNGEFAKSINDAIKKHFLVQSNLKEIVENILLFQLHKDKLSPSQCAKELSLITGSHVQTLSSTQIAARVQSVKDIISLSPWIFFSDLKSNKSIKPSKRKK